MPRYFYFPSSIKKILTGTVGDPAARHFPLRPVITDVTNPEVFQAMKEAIKEYQKSHLRCQGRQGEPLLPRRVVSVGNGPGELFTVHESNQNERDDYVALSYCWGLEVGFRTTMGNLGDLKAGLDVSVLPRTLQDAIEITRGLGYKYLWVDALCILQDCPFDKDREMQCRLWKSEVCQYTTRLLTEPDDRLRALQGVAQQLQQLWGAEYIFGLWQNAWPDLFAWVRTGPVPPSQRRLQRAPSWSWASVDFPIGFIGLIEYPMDVYKVEGGTLNPVGISSSGGGAGSCSGSTLCFRGRVIPCENINTKFHSPQAGTRLVFDLKDELYGSFYYLPLGRDKFRSEMSYWEFVPGFRAEVTVVFLIMHEIKEGTYQRIGAGKLDFDEVEWRRPCQEHPMREVYLS